MSFNSGEFNTAIKCASVKRFHLYNNAYARAVRGAVGGEKNVNELEIISKKKKKGFESHFT